MFIHNVYFWLKAGFTAEDQLAVLDDCRTMLAKIPSVRHLWSGEPVVSERPVVDSSYQVGLCVVFDDKSGHDEYQEHPIHKDFVARHKDKWKKIAVFDFDE